MLAGDKDALHHIKLLGADNVMVDGAKIPESWKHESDYQDDLCKQIDAYFSGDVHAFSFNKALQGTDMQHNVWSAISRIPYGFSVSYSDIAKAASTPLAIRAAASACGKNPLPIIVPCHRVLGKNGTLNGFAWGLHYKCKLLDLEHIAYKE